MDLPMYTLPTYPRYLGFNLSMDVSISVPTLGKGK